MSKFPDSPAAAGLPKLTIDQLQHDIRHLANLLDIVFGTVLEMDAFRDGQPIAEVNRLSSLAWVCREIAERTVAGIDAEYSALATKVRS